MKKNKINLAFADREPSLFIIQTPFQAMCAINAIYQLKINDYVLSLHLHKSTANRNRQTIELVERSGLKYNVVNVRSISFLNRLALFFCHEQKFNRVFLGTHLYQNGYYYALKEIKNGGNLVLLDDGVATLTLLESGYKVTGRSVVQMAINKAIASLRKIKLNNLLSVYKGIANPKWDIAYNDLSFLRNNNSTSSNKVFFIGTNNSSFIYKNGVDESDFKQNLYNILNKIRITYPNDEITYIPHGRDKSTFAKDFCEEIGIEYKPLDINVEIYILSLGVVPKVVVGFTSSALYNLKMIFPEANVENLVVKLLTDKCPSIIGVSHYYEIQGIPSVNV